ncbi:10007_t:CDS:2, partial [Racocetra fulgida]
DGKARPINWWLWGTLLYLILVVSAVFSYEGHIEKQKAKNLFLTAQAQELAKKISNFSLSFTLNKDEKDKAFGSVSSKEILDRLVEAGFNLRKSQLLNFHPLHSIGENYVVIKIRDNITTQLKVILSDWKSELKFFPNSKPEKVKEIQRKSDDLIKVLKELRTEEHIDTCQNISSTRASPYELVCDDCGKIIEIILSFKTIQKYTCSCKVEKYIKENSIVGVTIQNSTHLILRYDTGKENRVEVNSEQLEMVRDYYKDKYQKEVIAKQEEEQKEINRLRDENIFGLTTKHKIETLKRFGLLTIAGALIKLLGKAFDEKFIANFCYVIPLAFGVSPQTYTLNCVYSEEEVLNRDDDLRGNKHIKHIVSCGNLSCDYYKRLFNNRGLDASVGGPAVLAATTTALMFASEIAAPFTFGLSFVAISVLSFGSLAAGDYVSDNMIKKTIEEIENELKEK